VLTAKKFESFINKKQVYMRKILTLLAIVLSATATFAQIRTVTGKVIDQVGKPVPSATILVKGTPKGVSADENGNFKVSAKTGDVLTVSAVNYTPISIKVGSGNNISVTLSASESVMEEVVVTALGIKRSKNSLPYATQQVTAEELNRVPSTNVFNNLSGKVAGLQISSQSTMGGSTNVILRGLKSLTQSNQALFVVDGVPYDNTNQSRSGYDLGNVASDLNPDDVESITVLKGAAASALYGSRASNGVIVITTKKGSHKGKALGVSVNVGVQIGSPDKSTLPTYQTTYGQGYGSAGNDPGNPNIPGFFYYGSTATSSSPVKIVQTDVDAGTGPAYDPSIMVYNWDAFSPGNPNYGKATPWVPAAHHNPTDFFETPVTTITNVSIEGGGENGTFRLGYTNNTDKGIMPNSSILKNQLNFSSTYNVTSRLSVGGAINYVADNAINRNLYQYTGTTNIMTDFRQWWPTNVDILELKNDYFRTQTNATWNWLGGYTTNTLGNIAKPAYHNNPYFQLYQNYETDSRSRFFGNVNVNYKLGSHFNMRAVVSQDYYTQMSELRTNVGSVETSSYSRLNSTFSETNYNFLVNYDQSFGKFNVKALLGANVQRNENQSISSASNGGLVVPGFYDLANSKNTPLAPVEGYSQKEVDAVFAGATISYKELVTLDATIRRDQSSTLPKNNNAFYYPSVSGNFVFSKLLPSLNWLSSAKLRANYAQVGGDAPLFSLQNTYAAGTAFNSRTVFTTATTNNNPNLMPEQTNSYELGLEASFLKSRIGFDVTYYHLQSINQILPVTVSRGSGFNTFYVNGGTVQNQGVELSINMVPVQTKDFRWNLAINWSKNQSKTVSLYNGQPSYTVASYQNAIQLVAETGNAYGILRGTDYKYLNGQRLIDANGYYVLSSNKLSDIGNINPDWIGGITNSFKYKNVAFSFLIDVHQGGQLYSLDMDYGSSSGLYPENAGGNNDLGKPARAPLSAGGGIILKGVTADGKPNTTRIDESDINNGNYTFSSAYGEADKSYVYDASYVKLREVALSYSLPKKMIAKINFFKGIDIALTGRNLWIIHKNLPYSDPEQGQASGNASVGFQNGAYPSIRTFGCNVKFKF
jgi:TonB-linked SusC/RagA family outer membrane protein